MNVLKNNAIQCNKNNEKMNFIRSLLQKNTKKPKELWKELAYLLKQPQCQKYVLKKTISHNLMANKM